MSKKIPLTKLLAIGDWGRVEAYVTENGKCPTIEFLESLQEFKFPGDSPPLTIMHLWLDFFQNIADTGDIPRKRIKREKHGYALRITSLNHLIRFPCIRDGSRWIVFFGFDKPGAQKGLGKWRKEDEKRAKLFMEDYRLRKRE